MFLDRFALAAALLLIPAVVHAQSSPGFADGQPLCANVPNINCPGQIVGLNSAFASKQDVFSLLYTFQVPMPSTLSGNPTVRIGSTSTWPLSLYSFNGAVNTLSVIDQQGVGAGAFASRSSDWNSALANNSIAHSILSVHDRTATGPTGVWGSYWQSVKTAGAASTQQFQLEASFQNLGTSVNVDPFTINPAGSTFSARFDSGIGPSAGNPVSVAIQIVPNGNTFNSGISIGNGALTNRGGIFYGLEMPTNYSVVWYGSAGAVNGVLTVDNSSIFQMSGVGGISINGPLKGTRLQGSIIYSAAGTPLPTCNGAVEGSHASVSDATAPTYGSTYVSGGTVHSSVYCSGTNWVHAG